MKRKPIYIDRDEAWLTEEATALVGCLGVLVGESMNCDGTEVGREIIKHEKRVRDTLRAAIERGRESANDALAEEIDERDAANSRLQEINIALGGTGEWSNLYDCGVEALGRARDLMDERRQQEPTDD